MKKTLRILAFAMVAIMLCLCLASCGGPAADPDKAIEALEENGYEADDSALVKAGLKVLGVDDIDEVVYAINDDLKTLTIIYFDDKDAADAAWEDVQEYAEDEKDDEEESEWVCKKSGAMIYFGHVDAVKAAK